MSEYAREPGARGGHTGDLPPDLTKVQQKLAEIQSRKRTGIRWNVSKHTAELAIGALGMPPAVKPASGSGKQRRRKKGKRLL